MKRRDFLKSTLMFAAISSALSKATGLFNSAEAAGPMVKVKTLGYIEASNKPGKNCANCKHYKGAATGTGECTLPAMKTAMKATVPPMVKAEAYCNMWAKKA